jgi:hypothetical protein
LFVYRREIGLGCNLLKIILMKYLKGLISVLQQQIPPTKGTNDSETSLKGWAICIPFDVT